jgi:hypothetical protein
MERDDFLKDDWLKKLAGRVPLESPSGDFTSRVMAGIVTEPETVKAKKPFYLLLRTVYPWVLLGILLAVFLLSSDIPYLSFIPGKEFFHDHIAPYFTALLAGMAGLFSDSKALSITLAILASGGLLAGVDWFVRRRSVARHHTA